MKYKRAGINLGLAAVIWIFGSRILPGLLLALMPFIIGWILAYMINPPIRYLQQKLKIKRKAGSILVITLVILLICTCFGFLVRILLQKTEEILGLLPYFWKETRAEMTTIAVRWRKWTKDLPPALVSQTEEILNSVGDSIKKEVESIGVLQLANVENILRKLPAKLLSLLLSVLSACYFTVRKEILEKAVMDRIGGEWKKKISTLKETVGDILFDYFKVQLKIEFWIYLLLSAGFFILKIEYGFLLALPIAVLDLFPLFGTGLALLPWALFSVFSGNLMRAAGLGALWALALLLRQLIQPKMIGKSMGIGTFSSLFLFFLGYQWAGIWGMFFAVPLGILIKGMNENGFFENTKLSIQILWKGLEEIRRFTVKEKKEG